MLVNQVATLEVAEVYDEFLQHLVTRQHRSTSLLYEHPHNKLLKQGCYTFEAGLCGFPGANSSTVPSRHMHVI